MFQVTMRDSEMCAAIPCDFAPIAGAESQLLRKIDDVIDSAGSASGGAGRLANFCHAGNSFTADTLVLMADGSTKRIADIKIGDKVKATDPETNRTENREVTATHINDDRKFTDLILRTKDGKDAVIRTTQEHPFWDDGIDEWVNASDLTTSSNLRAVDGSLRPVAATRSYGGRRAMYNLTVAILHTYYVLASGTPILVHNKDCGVARIPNLQGRNLADAEQEISSQGFTFTSETRGGYRRYDHTDGSQVWIRPNGEVQRLGPSIDPGPNQKNYRQRYGPDGQVTQEHSTGETVIR